MEIEKRNKSIEEFNEQKIIKAIKGASNSSNETLSDTQITFILDEIKKEAINKTLNVEQIQDKIEVSLMELKAFAILKKFIIYREDHQKYRVVLKTFSDEFKSYNIEQTIKKIQKQFDRDIYNLELLLYSYNNHKRSNQSDDENLNTLIKVALEMTSIESPAWEKISARFLLLKIQNQIESYAITNNINSFYDKVAHLTQKKMYGSYILENYTKEEIDTASLFIDYNRNELFNYSGLDLLSTRYVFIDDKKVVEDAQELFLGIALHLAMNEKNKLMHVKAFYDVLSKLQVTVATPTLSNARKVFAQLSSCFIDTVPDDLKGIYRSLDNFAQVSKYGGGMGMYFGKVRAAGSNIRQVSNVSGGVNRWIKLANDTAVAVDQLGMRQGAVAVYLDVWHKDILDFLQLKTNNGDDRLKAHDVFPGICYPNLFWEMAENNINDDWFMFCPHEVFQIQGYHLEDFYGEEWEKRYFECINNKDLPKKSIPMKDIIRMIIKSVTETGTPFAFYRDNVNMANPNKHQGMIYSSNLCTEIAQNMKAIEDYEISVETIDNEEIVVSKTKAGDFVVCNLASLVLGNIDPSIKNELKNIVATSVRMLDNVIDLNFYPVKYAQITNQKYRAIGLGINGYHHYLAKNKIAFESQAHLDHIDGLFEDINYYALETSHQLAIEKGEYHYFKGSDYDNGDYFTLRNYNSSRWLALSEAIKQEGIRNGYLLAIAPTSSTSIIAGTTAGIDPIMKKYYLEEKKKMTLPRVAPNLNADTFWYYKEAHHMDQNYILKAAATRQRHIDQAQSMNLYITNEYSMRMVLNLYIMAAKLKLKSIYYVRSRSQEIEDCDSCSA